jgi:Phasin protein
LDASQLQVILGVSIMPTTEQDKPAAKSRPRNRKSDQRNTKRAQKAPAKPDQAMADSVPASPTTALMEAAVETTPVETAPIEAAPIDAAPADVVSIEAAPADIAPVVVAVEEAAEQAISGEVLLPEVRGPELKPVAGLPAIALAYGEYTRKSWQAGGSLIERLMTARSFEEAVEIQSEFTRQAYTNFLSQSQRICVLYGEWAQQFFRPFEKFAAEWPKADR